MTQAEADAATKGATIRKIADEAFAAFNSGGRHVLPFSTRYPVFSLSTGAMPQMFSLDHFRRYAIWLSYFRAIQTIRRSRLAKLWRPGH